MTTHDMAMLIARYDNIVTVTDVKITMYTKIIT